MKTLITGGSGLLGSAFEEGIKLSSKDCDLRSAEATQALFESIKPDTVIHSAAKVGGLVGNLKHQAEFYRDNILMNTNVIHSSYLTGVKRLVCFTSTCVFPDKVEYPLTEDKIHLGPPHQSNFGYAYSKRMVDVQLRAYNDQYGLNYFSIIPCNAYGPGDNFHLEDGHVLPALIHRMYLAKTNGTDFEAWGSGKALREFIFSKDLANIVTMLLEKYDGVDPIIVSDPHEYSIRELVETVAELMEFKGNINWLTDRPDGQLRKPSSNKKLLSVIESYNFISLRDGLKTTIDWFLENYPNIRK
jgi:GDP-L-fucose synthase